MSNVVEALGALHEDNQRMERVLGEIQTDVAGLKTDVAGLKTDVAGLRTDMGKIQTTVATLNTDVGKLLDHFGLVSGETP